MNQRLTTIITLLITGLIFVWPIANTIALRYAFGGLLTIATLFWFWLNRHQLKEMPSRPVWLACLFLAILTMWFVVQKLWLAPEADWVWQELRGQWLKDMVFWILGLSLGIGYVDRHTGLGTGKWLPALLAGLMGIVFWNVLTCFWLWLSTGYMPTMHGVTGVKATDSYINNMLLAFLVADLLTRNQEKTFLPWGRTMTIALVGICIVNTVFIAARNGWIGLGMLAFSGVVVHYINGWRRVGKKELIALPILLALLFAGVWTSWKTDTRWNSLKETLPIAWDIDAHKAWLNKVKYPFPVLPNGEQVDESNYERPAWIHAGLRLVADRPLGAGFSRHAFGHELARLYPESEVSPGTHSHSGMIDFAVGAGIPGVILWLGFVLTLIGFGGIVYFRHGAAVGLVLIFLTSGFFGRSLLDSTMRDHMLEQFMFISAFLLPSVARYWQKR